MAHQHAPRGPLKAKDPIDGEHPISDTCTATNNRGSRCKRSAIPGGWVCRYHGGNAPQVRAKAAERLAALETPAIAYLAWLVKQRTYPSAGLGAAKDILDRQQGKAIERIEAKISTTVAGMSDEALRERALALVAEVASAGGD